MPEPHGKTIGDAAIAVLNTPIASEKAAKARSVAVEWTKGELEFSFPSAPPTRPARPPKPELLPPNQMPRRRKAGTQANRAALLHAVAHIELNAIDLAFDIVARFGDTMPKDFTDNWVSVGDDEARHFTMLNNRLGDVDSHYGAYPAHDGLWQSSMDTADNLPARLAIVPMVLEARGLDVTPSIIGQFERVGDNISAEVLRTIYEEEVAHVGFGSKWFHYLAKQSDKNPELWFKQMIETYFKGHLKPPFNDSAREKAGLPKSFYQLLA